MKISIENQLFNIKKFQSAKIDLLLRIEVDLPGNSIS